MSGMISFPVKILGLSDCIVLGHIPRSLITDRASCFDDPITNFTNIDFVGYCFLTKQYVTIKIVFNLDLSPINHHCHEQNSSNKYWIKILRPCICFKNVSLKDITENDEYTTLYKSDELKLLRITKANEFIHSITRLNTQQMAFKDNICEYISVCVEEYLPSSWCISTEFASMHAFLGNYKELVEGFCWQVAQGLQSKPYYAPSLHSCYGYYSGKNIKLLMSHVPEGNRAQKMVETDTAKIVNEFISTFFPSRRGTELTENDILTQFQPNYFDFPVQQPKTSFPCATSLMKVIAETNEKKKRQLFIEMLLRLGSSLDQIDNRLKITTFMVAAEHLDLETFRILIESFPGDCRSCLSELDSKKNTVFDYAIRRENNLDIVKYLAEDRNLGHLLDIQNAQKISTFLCAVAEGKLEYIKYLVDYNKSLLLTKTSKGNNAIILAIYHDRIEVLEYLLSCGASYLEPNNEGINSVVISCIQKKMECLKIILLCDNERGKLIDLNAKVDKTNDSLASVVVYTTKKEDDEKCIMMLNFLEFKTDFMQKNNKGFNMFHHACKNGLIETVKFLIGKKYAREFYTNQTVENKSSLCYAIEEGHLNVVQLLLKQTFSSMFLSCIWKCMAAMTTINRNVSFSAMCDLVTKHHNSKQIKCLSCSNCMPAQMTFTMLDNNCIEGAKYCFFQPNQIKVDSNGNTQLLSAIVKKTKDMFSFGLMLLKHGLNPFIANKNGISPADLGLMCSPTPRGGNLAGTICQFLLDVGDNIAKKFCMACDEFYNECCKITQQKVVYVSDIHTSDSLVDIVYGDTFEFVKLLIRKKLDQNMRFPHDFPIVPEGNLLFFAVYNYCAVRNPDNLTGQSFWLNIITILLDQGYSTSLVVKGRRIFDMVPKKSALLILLHSRSYSSLPKNVEINGFGTMSVGDFVGIMNDEKQSELSNRILKLIESQIHPFLLTVSEMNKTNDNFKITILSVPDKIITKKIIGDTSNTDDIHEFPKMYRAKRCLEESFIRSICHCEHREFRYVFPVLNQDDCPNVSELCHALFSNNYEEFNKLCKMDIFDSPDHNGNTCLMYALKMFNGGKRFCIKFIELLVLKNSNPFLVNKFGICPFDIYNNDIPNLTFACIVSLRNFWKDVMHVKSNPHFLNEEVMKKWHYSKIYHYLIPKCLAFGNPNNTAIKCGHNVIDIMIAQYYNNRSDEGKKYWYELIELFYEDLNARPTMFTLNQMPLTDIESSWGKLKLYASPERFYPLNTNFCSVDTVLKATTPKVTAPFVESEIFAKKYTEQSGILFRRNEYHKTKCPLTSHFDVLFAICDNLPTNKKNLMVNCIRLVDILNPFVINSEEIINPKNTVVSIEHFMSTDITKNDLRSQFLRCIATNYFKCSRNNIFRFDLCKNYGTFIPGDKSDQLNDLVAILMRVLNGNDDDSTKLLVVDNLCKLYYMHKDRSFYIEITELLLKLNFDLSLYSRAYDTSLLKLLDIDTHSEINIDTELRPLCKFFKNPLCKSTNCSLKHVIDDRAKQYVHSCPKRSHLILIQDTKTLIDAHSIDIQPVHFDPTTPIYLGTSSLDCPDKLQTIKYRETPIPSKSIQCDLKHRGITEKTLCTFHSSSLFKKIEKKQ